MRKKSPKLKAVKSRADWGNGLAAFRERHGLTWRDFAAIFEGAISRRSLHRLCQMDTQPRFSQHLRPMLRESIRRFLEKKGVSQDQITLELRSVFCKEELETVITDRAVLSPEAQEFFRLNMDPFTGDPRTIDDVFTTPDLDRCLAHVMESVKFQGFNALLGKVGAGKSILRKRAAELCKRSRGKLVILWPDFFNMEKVHSGSVATAILEHFEVTSPSNLVKRATKVKQLVVRLAADHVNIALGFDECHRLDPRLLTALKNFWELGDGGFDRYIGLVLFGQPRFKEILAASEFQEISERLNIVRIPSLGRYAGNYISHRIGLAGGKTDRLFQPAALTRILKHADTPQALGNVVNAALMKAYEKGSKIVLPDFVPDPPGADPKVRGFREVR